MNYKNYKKQLVKCRKRGIRQIMWAKAGHRVMNVIGKGFVAIYMPAGNRELFFISSGKFLEKYVLISIKFEKKT